METLLTLLNFVPLLIIYSVPFNDRDDKDDQKRRFPKKICLNPYDFDRLGQVNN